MYIFVIEARCQTEYLTFPSRVLSLVNSCKTDEVVFRKTKFADHDITITLFVRRYPWQVENRTYVYRPGNQSHDLQLSLKYKDYNIKE